MAMNTTISDISKFQPARPTESAEQDSKKYRLADFASLACLFIAVLFCHLLIYSIIQNAFEPRANTQKVSPVKQVVCRVVKCEQE